MSKINSDNYSLSSIDIDNNVINKLNDKNINTIKELCNTSRKNLKNYGLSLEEINHIIIKLQLSGLDLSKKHKI